MGDEDPDGGGEVGQALVQLCHRPTVGAAGDDSAVVDRLDRRHQLVGPDLTAPGGAGEVPLGLGDEGRRPQGDVLAVQRHEGAVSRASGGTPGVAVQEQRQKTAGLGLFRQQGDDDAGEPDRLLGQPLAATVAS